VQWKGFGDTAFKFTSTQYSSFNLILEVTETTEGTCEYHNKEFRFKLYDFAKLIVIDGPENHHIISRNHLGLFSAPRKFFYV